ncbi:MAG TPA: Ig-like domain-containing protein [Solirubrobacterales bacterium]|jgi:hypothetical protein|nr:Ig-like domain-containing protein [Solirubrobacterales bacterium]
MLNPSRGLPFGVRTLAVLIVAAAMLLGITATASAAASSQNVLLVPSDQGEAGNGGELPTANFSDGYAPNFDNGDPADIADGSIPNPLVGYDTVVLVQFCSIGNSLDDSDFKSRLDSFVSGGGKLIIWDSECEQPDYSQFIYPFESNTPGANGSECDPEFPDDCFLTDIEENTLGSANPLSPLFVDTVAVATETDAVGDANVFTTQNPAWCVDMVARNVSEGSSFGILGPVQSYARFGSGLIIYNGLDMDEMDTSGPYDNSSPQLSLSKIFVQNLTQPFAPDGLPCGVVATGITLNPLSATNTLGQNHTVTATVRDAVNAPLVGVTVTFLINAGPNAGRTGTAVSDANGNATFTWTSTVVGTDQISATFDANENCQMPNFEPVLLATPCPRECFPQLEVDSTTLACADIRTSNVATKTWVAPVIVTADRTAPSARVSVAECRKTRRAIKATVSDTSGIASVKFFLDGKAIRTDKNAPFTATVNTKKLKKGAHRLTTITTDNAGNSVRTTRRFGKCATTTARVNPRFTG